MVQLPRMTSDNADQKMAARGLRLTRVRGVPLARSEPRQEFENRRVRVLGQLLLYPMAGGGE